MSSLSACAPCANPSGLVRLAIVRPIWPFRPRPNDLHAVPESYEIIRVSPGKGPLEQAHKACRELNYDYFCRTLIRRWAIVIDDSEEGDA